MTWLKHNLWCSKLRTCALFPPLPPDTMTRYMNRVWFNGRLRNKHFGPAENISKTFSSIAMKLCTDVNVLLTMNPTDVFLQCQCESELSIFWMIYLNNWLDGCEKTSMHFSVQNYNGLILDLWSIACKINAVRPILSFTLHIVPRTKY